MARKATTYTTEISGVVVIRDVCRDFVVRVFQGVPKVVEPTFFLPIMGYDPMLPHYTQHALNSLRKAGDNRAYAGSRLSFLLREAEELNGQRGRKFLTVRNLFEHSAHMMSVGGPSEYNTPEAIAEMIGKLAAGFGIETTAA